MGLEVVYGFFIFIPASHRSLAYKNKLVFCA